MDANPTNTKYVYISSLVQRVEKNSYKTLHGSDPGEHRLFVLMRDEFHPSFSLANFLNNIFLLYITLAKI